MSHATVIEINSQQFINNLQAIRAHINTRNRINDDKDNIQAFAIHMSKTKICLPVKANAYGHGLVGIAKLAQPYVDYLAVSCLDEGITLRQHGIDKPILVFGAFNKGEIAGLIANNLEITVSSQYKAEQLASHCQATNQVCKVHLKIDTGMNRVGVKVTSARGLFECVQLYPQLQLTGVYSHLASSDSDDPTFTLEQIASFKSIVDYAKSINPDIICHLANSGGVCYYPGAYFDMVRPGILSYGYFSGRKIHTITASPLNQIKPCFSLKSRIIYTKMVDKYKGISYNHTYTTKQYTRVVTVPIGYGDGYRRILSNMGEVLIQGKKYTVAGSICMDMLLVDIGPNGQGRVEDEVVLIGCQGNEEITLASVADKCNTIIYEVLCGFNDRIPRIYI